MTGDGITIRPFQPGDLDAFVEIYLQLATHHEGLDPARYRVPDREAVRARFERLLHADEDGGLHVVAEVGGRVVGQLDAWVDEPASAGGTRVPRASARVGVAVAAEARGRGVGTRLLLAAEAWARDLGLDELVLLVAHENRDAARLYERLGYEPIEHLLARRLR